MRRPASRRRAHAAFGDDLVEPAVEPRQRLGDAVVGLRSSSTGALRLAGTDLGPGDAFELALKIIQTLDDSGEVIADRVIVVVVFAICSASRRTPSSIF